MLQKFLNLASVGAQMRLIKQLSVPWRREGRTELDPARLEAQEEGAVARASRNEVQEGAPHQIRGGLERIYSTLLPCTFTLI